MKVLFVSSGRSGKPSYVIKNQGDSLIEKDITVEYFLIEGRGIWGYLKSIPKLRKKIKNNKYDIVHAHYIFSAFAASMAGSFPLVVSLMGSDTYMSAIWRFVVRIFYRLRWDATIVKTQHMKDILKISKLYIIPNGVNMERFKVIDKEFSREHIKYLSQKKLVIFVADPARSEKNFALAKRVIETLDDSNVDLMPVFNVPNEQIPYYLNAADVLLLTSKWEGSVNIVKEALACNLPIVSTDVGDVRNNTAGVEGCYVCSYNVSDLSEKLKLALLFGKLTNGRKRIIELGLDADTVAKKIINVYKEVLSKYT